jgi:hypothetical protein
VAPFADGRNHPSNLPLRAQLGPLFEQLGVQVVLTSHDQAYERTYPLVDVPASNTPTSLSTDCYTLQDGVTWVKASPGGKLSNLNGSFSEFRTEPAPPWTAVRDNSRHAFARLVVSAAGTLRVEAYGVVGDGSPPVLLDVFEYRVGECDGDSGGDDDGDGVSEPADCDDEDGGVFPGAPEVCNGRDDDCDALTDEGSPGGGAPCDTGLAGACAGGVEECQGGAVTCRAQTGSGTELCANGVDEDCDGHVDEQVDCVPAPTRTLLVSVQPDRSGAIPLEGRAVTDEIYVFVDPETDIDRVRYHLDDADRTGAAIQTENSPPYDLAGGSVDVARAFRTTDITEGPHVITTHVERFDGGTETIHTTFVVDHVGGCGDGTVESPAESCDDSNTVDDGNGCDDSCQRNDVCGDGVRQELFEACDGAAIGGCRDGCVPDCTCATAGAGFHLLVSNHPDRSSAAPLQGATVQGKLYVFLEPAADVDGVLYYLDDPERTGAPRQTENNPPFDFAGGSVSAAKPFDVNTITPAMHSITAFVELADGARAIVNTTFTVNRQ